MLAKRIPLRSALLSTSPSRLAFQSLCVHQYLSFPFLSFNVALFSFNGIPFFVSFFHSFILAAAAAAAAAAGNFSTSSSFFLCALRVRVYRHYFNILLLLLLLQCPLVAIIHRRSSFVDTTKTKHFNFVLTTKLVENSSSSNARRDRSSYGYELG